MNLEELAAALEAAQTVQERVAIKHWMMELERQLIEGTKQ